MEHHGQKCRNLTRCLRYVITENIKATHRTFYVQLLENRLNLNARQKFCKTFSFGQSMVFCESGALLIFPFRNCSLINFNNRFKLSNSFALRLIAASLDYTTVKRSNA